MATVAIELKNANQIQAPWTRWFIYGPTGAGKTTAASTFPSPLFICPTNENSMVTLRGADIPYVEVANRTEMLNVLDFLRTRFDTMVAAYNKGDEDKALEAFPWQTIVVESLSHYCELLVEDISKRGMNKMDMQGWGLLSSHLRTLHAQLCAIDVHVVYTSLESVDENGAGRPLMVGKNALMMPSACDVIAYAEAVPAPKGQEPIYRMHFRQHGRYPARSRFKDIPDSIDNFSFDRVAPLLGVAVEG